MKYGRVLEILSSLLEYVDIELYRSNEASSKVSLSQVVKKRTTISVCFLATTEMVA